MKQIVKIYRTRSRFTATHANSERTLRAFWTNANPPLGTFFDGRNAPGKKLKLKPSRRSYQGRDLTRRGARAGRTGERRIFSYRKWCPGRDSNSHVVANRSEEHTSE